MIFALLACAQGGAWTDAERATIATFGVEEDLPPRPTNHVADDPAAAKVGERFFHDPEMSADGKVACVTCHHPEMHLSDGLDAPNTLGKGTRNTPSIEFTAYNTWYFWDGRSDSAWSQATGPIRNPIEHGFSAVRVRDHVTLHDTEAYTSIFGPISDDPDVVLTNVGKAIEAFERTFRQPDSRFLRYVHEIEGGGESDSLSASEKRGLRLFIGKGGCVNCHHGPRLTDDSFHNIGLPVTSANGLDIGRAAGAGSVLADPYNCLGPYSDDHACPELHYLDPSFPDWAMAFKTPSLRNVAETAPYMHDGQTRSLAAVLLFYNVLPGLPVAGHRELTLQPLNFDGNELEDLEAFLRTL